MYIQSSQNIINHQKTTSDYKKLLKEEFGQNFRRVSKFNALALLGALGCLKNQSYHQNLSIYTASEYGCIEDMNKVLMQVNKKDEIVMPFDFLNVNGNNVGFLISQALQTQGNNFYVTSEDLSFEQAFHLAYFDMETNNTFESLVGGVDEAVDYIPDIQTLITNPDKEKTHDGSVWFYLTKNSHQAIAKIENFNYFSNIKQLNDYLQTIQYDFVSLNKFAQLNAHSLDLELHKLINTQKNSFFGTYSASILYQLLSYEGKLLHISLDKNGKSFVFYLHKHNQL